MRCQPSEASAAKRLSTSAGRLSSIDTGPGWCRMYKVTLFIQHMKRKPRSMCLLGAKEWLKFRRHVCDDLALCCQPPCLDAVLGGVGIEIDHPSLGTKVLETNDMVVPNHEADRCVTQFL